MLVFVTEAPIGSGKHFKFTVKKRQIVTFAYVGYTEALQLHQPTNTEKVFTDVLC